jgi:hypothetical protein
VAAPGRLSSSLEAAEPWVDDQVRRRLANFLTLFPGHTAFNVPDIAYGDWAELARITDEHVADRARGRRRR